jgi:hypothetical protein
MELRLSIAIRIHTHTHGQALVHTMERPCLMSTYQEWVASLGTFAKLLTATISIFMCLSVCLSLCMEQLCSYWTNFHDIWYLRIFRKSTDKMQDSFKPDMNNGYFTWKYRSRDSVVGIATRYELGGPGIESRWGRDFQHPSRPALGHTQPPIQWVPCLFPGCKATGAWSWPPTPI